GIRYKLVTGVQTCALPICLQLESCDITDTSIYAIAHSCRNLRGLNIKDCYYLSDVAINTLINKNPNICIPGWNPADINSESDSRSEERRVGKECRFRR